MEERTILSPEIQKGTEKDAVRRAKAGAKELMVPELLKLILESLEDSKAEEIVPIDITGKSPLADHMVIATGRSHRHVNAVTNHLLRDLKEAGLGSAKVEGMPACDWVLVDAGDIIVHVFRPEVREFYNLEKMWLASDIDEDA